ncbi:HEAT repeat domain-containing protein [Geomonas sp. RF6]|uniref:HEAT repeat domain-containing protein n=1 Tax=Geomonas sp. RF6 TaxID=2897342 RepID=UPI001E474539|nr:HEAT repeat domain-containing protein [Geomonas sp. RF6]UFS72192.1 HEAT repeat domain-containing protein [Geomonas sp. RF6]
MQPREKIDRTLVARQAVQEIVHRVRDEAVTLQELEEIGTRLKVAGVFALNTLLRALGKEEDPELISRYAYLLDFFEEEEWLSPLIGIALRRRELPEQGRVALLTALQEYGVDVDAPPFSSLLPVHHRPGAQHGAEGNAEADDDVIVTFLDDFLGYSTEVQLGAIRELSRSQEPWVVRLLEALLWHEDSSVVQGALEGLGRVRLQGAADAVADFLSECDPAFAPLAQHALRRLSFQGLVPQERCAPLPFHQGYVSAPDGDGYRSLLISRWDGEESLAALCMQVHERRGLLAAWGGEGLDVSAFEEEVDGFGEQEELYRVEPEYVVALVRDALYWSRDLSWLPADFYLRRRIFSGVDLTPAPFRAAVEDYRLSRGLTYFEGERISGELLEDPFCAGWLMLQRRVYEVAGRCRQGESEEEVLAALCAELIAPQVGLVAARLVAVADLMRECGRERSTVLQVLGLARSLQSYPLPYHLHPFLRRLASESLRVAARALQEGECPATAG